jgi:hypothetical protein
MDCNGPIHPGQAPCGVGQRGWDEVSVWSCAGRCVLEEQVTSEGISLVISMCAVRASAGGCD